VKDIFSRANGGTIIRETSDDLELALHQCQLAAHSGYKIAKDNLFQSSKAISDLSKSLSQCLKTIEDGSARNQVIVDQLKTQLVGVVNELEQLLRTTEQNLEERRQRLDRFSITLFGRTTTGKSTLMEILTRGNGQSIGSGAQRTTRDVRSYTWNGMVVTDVPGVAAFEGAEDEELAFKSASQADLVIFLISDDAPQPVEAECLARVRSLGKSVFGICNVKAAVDNKEDLMLFLRNPKRIFDSFRINQLLDQFHDFANQHIPGKRTQFIVTHLRSRFLAESPEFAKYRVGLLRASQFNLVESQIIEEVIGKGTFLRKKSFIDGAFTPMMDVTNMFLDYSALNSASGRIVNDKKRQLKEWSLLFENDGQVAINTFVSKMMNNLRGDISEFTEDHFEDCEAGERWNEHVKSSGINEKIEKVQIAIIGYCNKALIEVTRELKHEIALVAELAQGREISMDSIFDSKRAWNWGTGILTGGLTIASLFGPIGWGAGAAIGVIAWLFSFFFDDHEKKSSRAREKLSNSLNNNIQKMEDSLRKQLTNWFYQELLEKQVYVLLVDLGIMMSGLFALADAQRNLAWALNDRQKVLARTLVEEALRHLNIEDTNAIHDVARVPGLATMLLIKPNITFPAHIRQGLERLLGEKILFVRDTGNIESILSKAIGDGCERHKIGIEWKLKIAHIPLDELDTLTRSRVKLAQQLTGLHVMR